MHEQTVDYTALLHQVTQYQTADKRSGAQQKQRDDDRSHEREDDLT